jgi:hypothetical protein
MLSQILHKYEWTDSLAIYFFFSARGVTLEKSTLGMYRSLLYQLLVHYEELKSVFDTLPPTATTNVNSSYQLSEEKLKDLFQEAVQRLRSRVICFVEALDECPEAEIRDMLSFFDSLRQCDIQLQICVSSRHYPTITIKNVIEIVLERQSGHEDDIIEYLKDELKTQETASETDIRAPIKSKSSGIFLWVKLVVQILNKEYDIGSSLEELKTQLLQIPKGLTNLFHDIITRGERSRKETLLYIQ